MFSGSEAYADLVGFCAGLVVNGDGFIDHDIQGPAFGEGAGGLAKGVPLRGIICQARQGISDRGGGAVEGQDMAIFALDDGFGRAPRRPL